MAWCGGFALTTDGSKWPAATTTERHRERRARYGAMVCALARRAQDSRSSYEGLDTEGAITEAYDFEQIVR